MKLSVFVFLLSVIAFSEELPMCKDTVLNTPSSSKVDSGIWMEDFSKKQLLIKDDTNGEKEFGIKTFFQNMLEYSPFNSHGSCGYVSFIQYLCYFDSFYDDSLIPEKYEKKTTDSNSIDESLENSPGVWREDYPEGARYDGQGILTNSGKKLYDYIQSSKEYDLQAYYFDVVNSYFENSPEEYVEGIGMWNYQIVLDNADGLRDKNLTFEQSARNKAYEETGYDSQDAISYFDGYIKKYLDFGLPVMVHIKWKNGDYHSAVAYYYDDEGIHCNYGWNSLASTDVVVDNSDCFFNNAGVICINDISLLHSANYYVDGLMYCGCGRHVYHSYSYTDGGALKNYHLVACGCGYEEKESHFVFSDDIKRNASGYVLCSMCGAARKYMYIAER